MIPIYIGQFCKCHHSFERWCFTSREICHLQGLCKIGQVAGRYGHICRWLWNGYLNFLKKYFLSSNDDCKVIYWKRNISMVNKFWTCIQFSVEINKEMHTFHSYNFTIWNLWCLNFNVTILSCQFTTEMSQNHQLINTWICPLCLTHSRVLFHTVSW